MYILYLLLGLLAGGAAGYFFARRRVDALQTELRCQQAHYDALLQNERDYAARTRRDIETQFKQAAAEALRTERNELQAESRSQFETLVKPLHEELQRVERSVEAQRTRQAEEQARFDQAMAQMAQQTDRLGHDAAELTRALRGNLRVQGDWGEQVLTRILEASGLRKGEEFCLQATTLTANGTTQRPDVLVNLPGDKHIIIDAKVSLTAYIRYATANDEAGRKQAEQENLQSVRRHIDTLSAKNYERLREGTLSQVLMFVPNEGSYLLAIQADPTLAQYAFRKKVLLVNPSSLMLTLEIAHSLWQTERQEQGIRRIVESAEALYDKFVVFTEKLLRAQTTVGNALTTLEEAERALHTGPGNIVRRLEQLRAFGVSPKKKIPRELTDNEEADSAAES